MVPIDQRRKPGPRPKAKPQTVTVYSIAKVVSAGEIEEITGVVEQRGTQTVIRPQNGMRHGYVIMGARHLYMNRRSAVLAGRELLKAHADKYRQMARDLR